MDGLEKHRCDDMLSGSVRKEETEANFKAANTKSYLFNVMFDIDSIFTTTKGKLFT